MAEVDAEHAEKARRVRETLNDLVETLQRIPVPGSRPHYTPADKAAGLTLLDLSLRMEHVHRVTEELTLVDSTHMRRSVAVDVDLRRVNSRQRAAVAVRPLGPLVATPDAGPDRDLAQPPAAMIWVPIARQSRSDHAAIDILNDRGEIVPRLTSSAVHRALVAGLNQLIRTEITASSKPSQGGWRRRELQSRWLIERAVAHCIDQVPRSGEVFGGPADADYIRAATERALALDLSDPDPEDTPGADGSL